MTESIALSNAREKALDRASRLDPTVSTVDEERDLAEAIIEVRSHLRTKSGSIDWHARTGEAKSISSEIYSAIDADQGEIDLLKGRLRQHFLKILDRRMPEAPPVDDLEDAFTPASFYDDLGIFIANLGRKSESDTEALQLIVAAGKLVELIDVDSVREDGPIAVASVLAALEAVSDAALNARYKLSPK